jgi:3-hydroxyacyl-CoA dehydrogenase/enoyl-CoA hydratase/3-hydroxybutyryl-CoA epimerase/enoyl-CoA isomerase
MYAGKSVTLTLAENGVAELVLNASEASVNVMNTHLQDELGQALAVLTAAEGVKGLLLSSAKSAFVLGADITEFTALFDLDTDAIIEWAGRVHTLLDTIENLPYPSVAVVNGMALGGGMELALSTDLRVTDSKAKLGLPEVNLGICPGWGGTVRLARLVGAEAGLSWMLTGKPVKAMVALEQGAVDAVAEPENLMAEARAVLQQAIDGERDYMARRNAKQAAMEAGEETAAAMAAARSQFGKRLDPRYPAAPSILNSVTEAMDKPFADAIAIEARCFSELAIGFEAKNLVGLFLSDQVVKKKTRNWAKQGADVKQAATLGAGIMGGGISYQSALSGIGIRMKDITQEALDLGMSTAGSILDRSISRGRMTEEGKEKILSVIEPSLTYEGFDSVDYVVEAVVERVDVKRAVLSEVEQKVPASSIVASNTSTISIDLLAETLARPEQFCGMHFFNPVHAMQLVEIIRGTKTSEETIATTVAYAASLGKTPIVVRDCPGFLVNRVLFPYFNGFNRLLMDGVDFERIDAVMEQFGWPMGPAYLADVIGLDTMVHADRVLEEGFPERMGHTDRPVIETLLEQGALGQKNGVGFYEYGKDENGKRFKRRSEKVSAILEQRVSRNVEVTDAEIIERMMIPMCLETALCLEEGIVDTAAEADMGLIMGLGFPRFRGGALRHIDTVGAATFAAQVEAHAAQGPLYVLTDGVRDMAANGKTFF